MAVNTDGIGDEDEVVAKVVDDGALVAHGDLHDSEEVDLAGIYRIRT